MTGNRHSGEGGGNVIFSEDMSDDDYLEALGYKPSLTRALGAFSSFALQFGQIAPIGGIVFTFSVGLVAVGPAMMWPWIIGGGLQLIVAALVAEACSAYPVAGGAYNIVSRRAGRFVGWQTGYWIELAHIMSLAGSCVGITPVIMSWFGVTPGRWATVGIAGGFILVSTLINLASVKIGSRFVNVAAAATIAACALVTVGLVIGMLVSGSPLHGADFLFGTSGQVKGSIVLPLLYAALLPCIVLNGFDVSGNASEETTHASRTIPTAMLRANISAYAFGTVMILLLILAMGGVAGTLSATMPVTSIIDPVVGHSLAKAVEVIATYGLFVSAVVLQMAGARVLWAQARDNRLPFASKFGHLNRENVPSFGIWFGAVVAFLAILWSSLYVVLIAMTVVLWVGGYATLMASMYLGRLRDTVPNGAYRVKHWRFAYPLALIWSGVLTFALIYQNPKQVGLGLLIAVVLGLVCYQFVPRSTQPRVTHDGAAGDPSNAAVRSE
jgi:amino acid transporter